MRPPPDPFHRVRRWGVLAAYTAVVGINQMLWLNFGPLLSLVQRRYGVSELAASSLLLVFPLLYVVFSIPAGRLIDRRGYRFAVGAGALVMAAFSCVRIFDGTFAALLLGQVGIAVAQPYLLNAISKLVADWFSEEQGALATGLGTMGIFLGMAAGMAATPALVQVVGLRATMTICAALTCVSAVVFLLVVHGNEQAPPASDAPSTELRGLLRDRRLLLLFALSFLGLGVFNGLTTWLEQILAPHGIDAERAGLVGGALIVGGIVGAVVIPALSDLARRRQPFLLACAAAAMITVYPLGSSARYPVLLVAGLLHGFFFMPAFALLLEMSSQLAGARSAGAATGLLTLAGNAGGVVVIVAMPVVKGAGPDFGPAVILLVVLLGLATLLAALAPETAVRSAAAVDTRTRSAG
jgi:predicted MFS family arabinose efflux permease